MRFFLAAFALMKESLSFAPDNSTLLAGENL
jgi:hypothetical protein